MNAFKQARDEDNLRARIRGLATPRVVDLRDCYEPVEAMVRRSRRKAGLSARIRDVGVVRRVVSLITSK